MDCRGSQRADDHRRLRVLKSFDPAEQPAACGQTCSRGRSAVAPTGAVELAGTPAGAAEFAAVAAPGGGTCAGGVASASSSSFIPALKALIPLAKSPITRGSFPAPKRIRIM